MNEDAVLPRNRFGQSLPTTAIDNEVESPDDQFAVDDAENPLQLLARASDLSAPSNQTPYTLPTPLSGPRNPLTGRDQKLRDFFGPFRPSLDVEPDIDPMDMGLVTEEEAAVLFT